ncbi:MAG: Fic family protein [Defluviicoccus sp.]|nr:Fic family protein [Defluviicoccus sp.]
MLRIEAYAQLGGGNIVKPIRSEELQAIEETVRRHPEGMTTSQIAEALGVDMPRRTLQYRLKSLVDDRRLVREGSVRWARYRAPKDVSLSARTSLGPIRSTADLRAPGPPLSEAGLAIREYVRRSPGEREPVGYERDFLESYRPGESFFLSEEERTQLRETGTPRIAEQPAGTYAKRILDRLLIDLSWNSSRLEGNTYSLLDTRRLIEAGEEAEGKNRLEAQMILNHKEAIEFLVDAAADIGFDRYTILNLHAALADNLLLDPEASGRLRHIRVGIEGSVFHPLEVPQLIEECFDLLLFKAAAIEDPFEQAFFALVQLPYLQPFDDVNKRVSRLAANIPLIRANLAPLSFEDVSRELYTEAILGVYELNRTELLRDLFLWAYRRSAARYAAVRQSLGEPDPFRMRHRSALREIVGTVVRGRMDQRQASRHIAAWTDANIDESERPRFRAIAERELLGLHEGNFARYRVTPSEFAAWQEVWDK